MNLLQNLHEWSLRRGDWLAVFGDLEPPGAEAGDDSALSDLADALREAIGPEGHVLVPTFTDGKEFDRENTPAATGRFAEWFRRQPGVVRSRHPSHSVAVSGPKALDVITDHDLYLPFLPETPLGQLVAAGGKAILFGGDQRANALIQIGRLSVERPRPVLWFNIAHVLEFGGRRRKRHVEQPCDHSYSALGPDMETCGVARPVETPWGRGTWMEARAVFDYAAAVERNTPERLLCSSGECRWCKGMKYFLETKASPHV